MEAGGGDDDVGFDEPAGPGDDALALKPFDLVGDDDGLSRPDRAEKIAVGDERDALPPRPVCRREMGRDVEAVAKVGADRCEQLLPSPLPARRSSAA